VVGYGLFSLSSSSSALYSPLLDIGLSNFSPFLLMYDPKGRPVPQQWGY
jgi:hypothetical protein